jgi:uncharacterized protein (DUF736 family)
VNKQYDNNNRGVLFKNDQKGNEKAPNYSGSAVIDNIDLNISAWIKRSRKTGNAFMSLKFEPKQKVETRPRVMDESPVPDFDDDMPF